MGCGYTPKFEQQEPQRTYDSSFYQYLPPIQDPYQQNSFAYKSIDYEKMIQKTYQEIYIYQQKTVQYPSPIKYCANEDLKDLYLFSKCIEDDAENENDLFKYSSTIENQYKRRKRRVKTVEETVQYQQVLQTKMKLEQYKINNQFLLDYYREIDDNLEEIQKLQSEYKQYMQDNEQIDIELHYWYNKIYYLRYLINNENNDKYTLSTVATEYNAVNIDQQLMESYTRKKYSKSTERRLASALSNDKAVPRSGATSRLSNPKYIDNSVAKEQNMTKLDSFENANDFQLHEDGYEQDHKRDTLEITASIDQNSEYSNYSVEHMTRYNDFYE